MEYVFIDPYLVFQFQGEKPQTSMFIFLKVIWLLLGPEYVFWLLKMSLLLSSMMSIRFFTVH